MIVNATFETRSDGIMYAIFHDNYFPSDEVALTDSEFQRMRYIGKKEVYIRQYSGGVLLREWHLTTIVNNSEYSDGYFFMAGDSLIEVSGDVQIIYPNY